MLHKRSQDHVQALAIRRHLAQHRQRTEQTIRTFLRFCVMSNKGELHTHTNKTIKRIKRKKREMNDSTIALPYFDDLVSVV